MKKLTLLFISLFAFLTMFAGEVTEAEALQKAQNFMKGKKFKQSNLRRAPSKEVEKHAFYVFNAENNGGFVIVSGDDRTEEILGYADRGSFDMDNLPPNLKEWLEGYSKQIESLETSGNTTNRASSRAPKAAIEPLITTKWGQGSPYNHQCPEIDGKHCVTGCVATAMAQVMYYHKWPQDACAAIPQYTTGTQQIEMPALPPTTFKWSTMRDRYWEGEQGESADAVAELMLYCGQAAIMQYDINGSYGYIMPYHFINYFGYGKNAKYITMSQYTMSQWEDILYNELSEGRPMLYCGYNFNDGHEFICDGYDGDGYYHFNWGWDGDANGFFLLSAMYNETCWGGYVFGQTAIIGLEPEKGETTIPYIYGYHGEDLAKTEFVRLSKSEDFSDIFLTEGVSIQYEIAEEQDVSLEYGLGLFKNAQLLAVLDQSSAVLNLNNNTVYKQTNVSFGKVLEDGVYQIRHIYKLVGNNDWETCTDSYINYIVATISANNLTLRKVSDTGTENATYTVNSVSFLGHIVTVNLTNTGDTNQEMLYLWNTSNEDQGELIYVTSSCGAIEPGETGDVVFSSKGIYENYPGKITADHSAYRLMWEGTITCPERVAEQNLSCFNISVDNCSNGVLQGSEAHVILTITNSGENIYNDVIGCDILKGNGIRAAKIGQITQPVLINVGETKDVEINISHLDNNFVYGLYFEYYGEGIKFLGDGPLSFLVAKNCVEYEGLNYSLNSKTASVIPGDNQALESLTIPQTITIEGSSYTVTEIAPSAFKGCRFQSVSLPEGLLSIGSSAFMSCDIKSISIPSTLKSISGNAFMYTTGLTEISIPEGVVSVGYGAFWGCQDLEVLRLPSTLGSMDDNIIFDCNKLKSVYSGMTDPIKVADNTFTLHYDQGTPIPPSATLYVPKGTIEKYKATNGWKDFVKIKEGFPGDVNGDNLVNVTDIVATVNYIMEKPSDGFNKEAADLNGDGEINVTDIVKMVSIIMAGDN